MSASRVFYLSIFALWATSGSCAKLQTDQCPISSKSIVDDACVSYSTLEKLNTRLKSSVDELVRTTDYFSHYRLNLFNKQCPFWEDENGFCANIGCAVETLENEEDVPAVWRAKELSKLEGPLAKHPGRTEQRQHPEKPLQGQLGDDVGESCVMEYDDEHEERDYCIPEDESVGSKGDYVSLLRNPERFTGYGGDGAWLVWDAIYRENCFSKASFSHSANLGISQLSAKPAEQDFRQVLGAAGRQNQLQQKQLQRLSGAGSSVALPASNVFELEDQCLEKRVFYRIISGMHASISSHLCWDYLNQTTGKWQPNVSCYQTRLHDHPDRISNLYFNYALVTRAVAKLGSYLQGPTYTFCTGDVSEDFATRAKVLKVTQRAAMVPNIFDESIMFVNGEGAALKEDFRNRFRNVSRLMDCVGCDKCRLWGKVQTAGYGAALKVLFEFDEPDKSNKATRNSDIIPHLKRTEIVALFNTYARLGESIASMSKFRALLEAQEHVEAKLRDAERGQNDFEEEEDQYVKEFIRLRRAGPKSDGAWDLFEHELERFKIAVRIVVSKWIRLPRTLWSILISELIRLWQFWVGLPVNKRWWRFELPNLDRDEL